MIPTAEGPTIQTSAGDYFDFLNPHNSQFDVKVIASALSKICRFTGHCSKFYSVAEHATYVSEVVEEWLRINNILDESWDLVYQAHHHDDPEAFIGDVSNPLKRLLPDYKAIEKNVEEAVFDRLGITCPIHPLVKNADMILLKRERQALMDCSTPWPYIDGIDDTWMYDFNIQAFNPSDAEVVYLLRDEYIKSHLKKIES